MKKYSVINKENKVLFSNNEKSKCITFVIQKLKMIPSQQRDVYHNYLHPDNWVKIV